MKAIILCAGYATRLFPITKNFPKPLLSVGGKEILSFLVEKVNKIEEIDECYIITNDKYAKYFDYWNSTINLRLNIKIINDNTLSTDDALGAIGDLYYVINKENIDDDLLVLAGDTISEFKIFTMCEELKKHNAPINAIYNMGAREKIKNTYGCVEFDETKKIISFEEKPSEPKSSYKSVPYYAYPRNFIEKIKKYIEDGNDPKNIGDLITFFHKQTDFFVVEMDEKMFDIGNVDLLNEACEFFEKH